MELVVINGKDGNHCAQLANRLRVAGYKHFDADMFFIEDDGNFKHNIQKIIAAKTWCKREALNAVLKGHSVVISSTSFNPTDLRGFHVVNCPVELIEVDNTTAGQLNNLIQARADAKRDQHWWQNVSFRFLNMLRA
jgi:hypothetical protein